LPANISWFENVYNIFNIFGWIAISSAFIFTKNRFCITSSACTMMVKAVGERIYVYYTRGAQKSECTKNPNMLFWKKWLCRTRIFSVHS
jgi:hypothetical protein